MLIGIRLGSRVALTFFNQSRGLCTLSHKFFHLDVTTGSIDPKVMFAIEVDRRWVFGISTIAGQDKKGFVVYGNVSVLQCLRSGFDELHLTTDGLEEGLALFGGYILEYRS